MKQSHTNKKTVNKKTDTRESIVARTISFLKRNERSRTVPPVWKRRREQKLIRKKENQKSRITIVYRYLIISIRNPIFNVYYKCLSNFIIYMRARACVCFTTLVNILGNVAKALNTNFVQTCLLNTRSILNRFHCSDNGLLFLFRSIYKRANGPQMPI